MVAPPPRWLSLVSLRLASASSMLRSRTYPMVTLWCRPLSKEPRAKAASRSRSSDSPPDNSSPQHRCRGIRARVGGWRGRVTPLWAWEQSGRNAALIGIGFSSLRLRAASELSVVWMPADLCGTPVRRICGRIGNPDAIRMSGKSPSRGFDHRGRDSAVAGPFRPDHAQSRSWAIRSQVDA